MSLAASDPIMPSLGPAVRPSDFRVKLTEIFPTEHTGEEAIDQLSVDELAQGVTSSTPYLRELLESDEPTVLLFEQLVSLHGTPLYLNASYISAGFDLGSLTRIMRDIHDSQEVPPVREVFAMLFGRPYGGGTAVVEAVRCDPHTARHLQVLPGSPILLREMVLRDVDGRATNVLWTHYRPDRVEICSP